MTDKQRFLARIRSAVQDIVEAAEDVTTYVADKTQQEVWQDRLLRQAVERQLITIGEAVARIRKIEAKYDQTSGTDFTGARGIISFRNILVHNYDLIEADFVWMSIQHHLPKLLDEAHAYLQDSASGPAAPDQP